MDLLCKPATRCAVLMMLALSTPAGAQTTNPPSAVTLPANGTFAREGQFTGTVTINRFEEREGAIVAIGFVQGVLRLGQTTATALRGEVEWPVIVKYGGVVLTGAKHSSKPGITRIVSPIDARSTSGIVKVQNGCQILDVTLAPVDVNLLGVTVSLSPVMLSLAGESGTPLGGLVCAVLGLIGNIAGLVELLNDLLGLLTGLLGGLTGGLG